jgi:hypothetical protein
VCQSRNHYFNPGRKEKERGWLTFCVNLNVQSEETDSSQQILVLSRLEAITFPSVIKVYNTWVISKVLHTALARPVG